MQSKKTTHSYSENPYAKKSSKRSSWSVKDSEFTDSYPEELATFPPVTFKNTEYQKLYDERKKLYHRLEVEMLNPRERAKVNTQIKYLSDKMKAIQGSNSKFSDEEESTFPPINFKSQDVQKLYEDEFIKEKKKSRKVNSKDKLLARKRKLSALKSKPGLNPEQYALIKHELEMIDEKLKTFSEENPYSKKSK